MFRRGTPLIGVLVACFVATATADAWKMTRTAQFGTVKLRAIGKLCTASRLGVWLWTATGTSDGKTILLRWNEPLGKADGRYRRVKYTQVSGTAFSTLPNRTRRAAIAKVFDEGNKTQVAVVPGAKALRYRYPGRRATIVAFMPRAGC